jgi:hypothetical protein
MEKRKFFVFVFLFFLFVLFSKATNETWEYNADVKKKYLRLSKEIKPDSFDEFCEEVIYALTEILPDEKILDAVCKMVYVREDIYYDKKIIVLYVCDKGKNTIIWTIEKSKINSPGAIKNYARDAAHLLLHRLGGDGDKSSIITPSPKPKKITL